MATEMSLRVGERIRQRRQELGIRTQRELAELIPVASVTNQTVNKWEKGANEPSARYKALLAQALEVDVSYFIADTVPAQTPDPFGQGLSTNDQISGLTERLDRIETQLAELTALVEATFTARSELGDAITAQLDDLHSTFSSQVGDAAQRLEASVAEARSVLRAASQDPLSAAPKRAPKRTRAA